MCFIGDFNCVRDESERVNYIYRRNDIVGFNQFMDNANLLDLALGDAQFTWFGRAIGL